MDNPEKLATLGTQDEDFKQLIVLYTFLSFLSWGILSHWTQ